MRLSFPHLVSVEQVTRADADAILTVTEEMEKVLEKGGDDRLKGKILASLFYEPSTRTRLSFESAMMRLGGQVLTADGVQTSSLYKGESIEDTIRMASGYADVICMRHPTKGSAQKAADAATVPFVNAGDGPGEHPTQALLDLYTIRKERGTVEGLHVAMVGDLKFGRTVHSLSLLLTLFPGIRLTFVSPAELTMPDFVTDKLAAKGTSFERSEHLEDALKADVLYMTRIQKERFESAEEYEKVKDAFVLRAEDARPSKASILHPLPRLNEIETGVDELLNAAYFRQARNGVPVRMALLSLLLDR